MNIAINFYSEPYRRFVNERLESIFEDTDVDYDGIRFLQDIARDMTIRFFDYLMPNNITLDELATDDDAVIAMLANLMIHIGKIYPGVVVIGFYPVDLKGHVIAVIQSPAVEVSVSSITQVLGREV
jgi:hypothetical protein